MPISANAAIDKKVSFGEKKGGGGEGDQYWVLGLRRR